MKARSKRYDPDLGAKFLSEYGSLVIGRGSSSDPSSSDEGSIYQDEQETHDRQMPDVPKTSNSAQRGGDEKVNEKADGELRIAKYLRNNPEKMREVLAKVRKTKG
jgi:hypothetical protein